MKMLARKVAKRASSSVEEVGVKFGRLPSNHKCYMSRGRE